MKFKDVVFKVCEVLECIFLICACLVLLPIVAIMAIPMSPIMLYDWYEKEKREREHAARSKEIWGDRSTSAVGNNDSVCDDEEEQYGMS